METLAERAAKRAKASTGDKAPASIPRTPVVVEISPDNSARRSPSFSAQHPPSTGQEDADIVIEEVAKDAEAEAAKIAAGEAAKSTAEEATKGIAGQTGEAATGDAGKGPAGEPSKDPTGKSGEAAAKEPTEEEVANDQPPSPAAPTPGKYLRVGDDLFVRLLGTTSTRALAEGELFDDEALTTVGLHKLQALHRACQDKAKSRMAAAVKAEADFEERVAQTHVWFGEARDELRAAQGELDERKRELILKQADIEKAEEAEKDRATKDEAAGLQQQALLNSQEEDLVACKQALATTLRGKDEEVEKLVAQQTHELDQKHKDTLSALALDHAGEVKKLELEREELEKKVLELTEERDTANRTLADS
nr:uncharacterized protein LOC109786771 [Aegilops tauschii subsp. strangulata]